MNILFVSNLFPSSTQPTRGIYNLYLLNALQSIGWTIEVINPLPHFPGIDRFIRKKTLPPKMETLNELMIAHPTFFYTPGVFIEKHYWFYRLKVAKAMKAGIKRLKKYPLGSEKPIHVMLGFIYPDAVALAPLCQKLGLDYSVSVYGSDFRLRRQQPKFRSLTMQCLHEAPKIFCPGHRLKEDMVSEGIDEAKIFPFNNGTDPSVFYFSENKNSNTNQDRQNVKEQSILFVGNLVDVKKVDRLVKAFALLVQDQSVPKDLIQTVRFRLDIVGDGPLLPELKLLTQTLGVGEQVNFPGRELPQKIASRMQKATCFCLCSASEGMPNVIVEALTCGCPVVATDVGEVPYLIEDGVNGYSVATNNQSETEIVKQLCNSLLKVLLKEDWNRQQIADNMKDYTWPTAAKTIESALVN